MLGYGDKSALDKGIRGSSGICVWLGCRLPLDVNLYAYSEEYSDTTAGSRHFPNQINHHQGRSVQSLVRAPRSNFPETSQLEANTEISTVVPIQALSYYSFHPNICAPDSLSVKKHCYRRLQVPMPFLDTFHQ